MARPTRDTLERQIRATLALYGYPIERVEDGRAYFDPFHEQLIATHVDELDRLWTLAEDAERSIVAACKAGDELKAMPNLMRAWQEPGVRYPIGDGPGLGLGEPERAPPFDPFDPYDVTGGES